MSAQGVVIHIIYNPAENRFQQSDQKAGLGLSQTRPIPRSPDGDKDRRTMTLNLQPTFRCDGKAATDGFPTASSTPYVVEFGPI